MSNLRAFLALSVALTGYDEAALLGTGQAEAYLAWVEEHVDPATLRQLWARAERPLTDEVLLEMMAAPPLGLVLRQINYLWYTAQWQELVNGALSPTAIVSPAAYQEALVWPTALAHPPGAKQTGFASWTRLPGPGAAS